MIDIPPLKKKNRIPDPNSLSGALGWDRFVAGDTNTFKDAPMKKEADGMHPSSHYLVVVDPKKSSTWHLRVRNVDGELDNRLLGAAQSALTVGYRGNKYQGPNRGEALVKLRKLRKQSGLTNKQSILTVFKDKNGEYWWVALSSNAYRDRDGEIVSQKALRNDVERADRDGDYGPLRFWHMPGVDIGDAEFNMMHGRTLIEAGKFRDLQTAHAVAQKAHDYQVSIGFNHPTDEPDKNGVFHNIKRFERSLVPSGRASNPFTSLSVTRKENQMTADEKIKAFKALLDNDALASQFLERAEINEKQADSMGVAFKEVDLSNLTADELLDFAIAKKEFEMAESQKANEEGEDMEEDDYKMGDYMKGLSKKMDEYSTKMDNIHQLLQRMGKKPKPEATTKDTSLAEATDIHTQRIANLEAQITQLTQTVKELASLPSGVIGVRATQDSGNVINEQPVVEKAHQNGQATAVDGFLDFVVGGEI